MAPDDWKAWLELSLLVAVTVLALGRWIFGREHADVDQARELNRQRDRVHNLGMDLNRLGLQVAVIEERVDAAQQRLDALEDRRDRRPPNNRRNNQS